MSMRKTYQREKQHICGEYLDVYLYPVFKRPGQRAKRANPTTATQASLNQRHAEERVTRLLHANFTPEDLELGLSYEINPESDEEATRLARNFLRRLKRLRQKLGLSPLKYICVTEKSKRGRYHHHVTVNGGIDRDVIENLWGLGYANTRRLQFTETGLAGLGRYIVKEPIGGKRWNASKNLIDPEPITNDMRISRRTAEELAKDPTDREPWERLYPEYIFAESSAFHNDTNGGVYLFARLYRRDGKFIKPKRKGRKSK